MSRHTSAQQPVSAAQRYDPKCFLLRWVSKLTLITLNTICTQLVLDRISNNYIYMAWEHSFHDGQGFIFCLFAVSVSYSLVRGRFITSNYQLL
ncbi:hypothetical protein R3P38DRAFT_2861638 [Favolaschia claudopus]|uniref:CASP-like protein n=1 Tax=Favolaschia claudopus TaxID=2862362 RepID=A0AAW0DKI8_9AGAR